MKSNIFYYLFFIVFGINLCNSQQINIVNSSSNYSNNLEYNTGEIFVVYDFNSNLVTSKVLEEKEKDDFSNIFTQIKLYPNPTVSLLYYSLPNEFSFERVELYDQNLKIIFSSNENIKQISLEYLPSGTYYVMFNSNREYNFKIIKN